MGGLELQIGDGALLHAFANIAAEGIAIAIGVLLLDGFAVDGVGEVVVALVGGAIAGEIEALQEGIEDGDAAIGEAGITITVLR